MGTPSKWPPSTWLINGGPILTTYDTWEPILPGSAPWVGTAVPGEGPVTVTSDGIIAESSVPRWVRNPWFRCGIPGFGVTDEGVMNFWGGPTYLLGPIN